MKYKDFIEKWAKENGYEDKIKEALPFIELQDQRGELFGILQGDVSTANEALKQNPTNQYLRRTVVRTTFAMVEGLLNMLAQNVLDGYRNKQFLITKEELEKITEEVSTKKGNRRKFMPIGEKVTFSFKIFAQKFGGVNFLVDSTTEGWDKFEEAVSIRNHLTHPRQLDDMSVDNKQISLIMSVSKWFIALYTKLLNQIGDAMQKNIVKNLLTARIKGIQSGK